MPGEEDVWSLTECGIIIPTKFEMPMSELSYPDTCTILRNTGEVDEWDNLNKEEIYSGPCDFQPGGQTSLSIVTHNDVVYLPSAVMVKENDIISVTTALGRRRDGIVKLANDLGLDLSGDYITEIEISQSVGK